jgi:ferredoxin-type protein NapH
MKMTVARKITVTLGALLVVVGLVIHTGTGTLSSFGWQQIALICPLGALEVFLATKLLIPHAAIAFALMAVGIILLGKVFCAWLCPIPPLRSLLKHHKKSADKPRGNEVTATSSPITVCSSVLTSQEGNLAAKNPVEPLCSTDCLDAGKCTSCHQRRAHIDSRHLILGGALLSTALFGFPVFCIICPVGLSFATLIALWRFVGFFEFTLSLLIFPAVLLIEIFVLRTWCHRFCPLGATISLLSLPNRFFRPVVDKTKCLRTKGGECSICSDTCEEMLDPHYAHALHECTKCGMCKEQCPAGAISFAFLPKTGAYLKK